VPVRAADIREHIAAILADRKPRHLVHVGAHDGEEVPYYLSAGIGRITLVEPIPDLADRLRRRWPDLTVVQAACSDREGVATLRIPGRTNMAGLDLLEGEPVPVMTRRLDVIAPDADAAVIDVQGHEFQVLAAAPWPSLRLVVVETCTVDDATLSPPYDAMVDYMAGRGFVEVTRFVREYDWIQRWAYGRTTTTGAEVRDVVFVRD
jgi:FkbM family methyltransferase